MHREASELDGVKIFGAKVFPDQRGYLLQSYVESGLRDIGISGRFCQAIQSNSKRGVVRGLHFQWAPPQGKLVRCVAGRIFDVVVDVRPGSPTLGDHTSKVLSGENHDVIWIPLGFAHGFMAIEDHSIVLYECTAEWSPGGEGGIRWNDPSLEIQWPELPPIVSEKDRIMPTLAQWLDNPASGSFRLGS